MAHDDFLDGFDLDLDEILGPDEGPSPAAAAALRSVGASPAKAKQAQIPEDDDSLWDTVTQPFKSLFGVTASLGGRVGQVFAPEAYERARVANLEAIGAGPEPSTAERLEALPGLGDVVVEAAQPTSTLGKAVSTPARIALNALADPSTYVPIAGVAGRLGKAAGAVAKGARGAAEFGELAKAAGQFGLRAPFSSLGAAVYGPETVEALGAGGGIGAVAGAGAMALAGRSPYLGAAAGAGLGGAAEAAASGAGAGQSIAAGTEKMLLSGLASLMARGVIDEATALRTAYAARTGRPMPDVPLADEVPGGIPEPQQGAQEAPGAPQASEAGPGPTPAAVVDPAASQGPSAAIGEDTLPPQAPPAGVLRRPEFVEGAVFDDSVGTAGPTGGYPPGARPELGPREELTYSPEGPPAPTLEQQLQGTLDAVQRGENVLAPKDAPGRPRGQVQALPESEALALEEQAASGGLTNAQRMEAEKAETQARMERQFPERRAQPREVAPGIPDWTLTPAGKNIQAQLEARGIRELPYDVREAQRLLRGPRVPSVPEREVSEAEKGFRVPEPGEPTGEVVPLPSREALRPGETPEQQSARLRADVEKDYPAYQKTTDPKTEPMAPEVKEKVDAVINSKHWSIAEQIAERQERTARAAGLAADRSEILAHMRASLARAAQEGGELEPGQLKRIFKNASVDALRRLKSDKAPGDTKPRSLDELVAREQQDTALRRLEEGAEGEAEKAFADLEKAEKLIETLPDKQKAAMRYFIDHPKAKQSEVFEQLGFGTTQALGRALANARSKIAEALGREAPGPKVAAERPQLDRPEVDIPDPKEGQDLKGWAGENKDAILKHVEYAASLTGRGPGVSAARKLLFALSEAAGRPIKDPSKAPSSPKVARDLLLALDMEVPGWIRELAGEKFKPGAEVDISAGPPKGGIPAEQPRRQQLKVLKADTKEPGRFSASSDEAALDLTRTGNQWNLEDVAGPADKVVSLLSEAIPDLGEGFTLRLDRDLMPDILEAVGKKLFVVKEGARFTFLKGEKGLRTLDFLGLQQLSEITGKLAGAGLDKAGQVVARGYELIATGLRDGYEWAARMVREFGNGVAKHARSLFNQLTASERGAANIDLLVPESITRAIKGEPVKPTMEAVEGVMLRAEDAPKAGKPGGGKGLEDTTVNTLRVQLDSEDALKDAVALDKVLGRTERRGWGEVKKDVEQLAKREPPEAFVRRVLGKGAVLSGLSDTDTTYLRMVLNTAFNEVSGAKKRFNELLEKDGDMQELANLLDDTVMKIGTAEGFLGLKRATQSATARALAAMRMHVTGLDPQLMERSRLREHLKHLKVGVEDIDSKVLPKWDAWKRSGKSEDLDGFLSAIKDNAKHSLADKALFLYKAFLLTPASIMANVASNAGLMKLRRLEQNVIAPGIDALWTKVGGGERSVYRVPGDLYSKVMREGVGLAYKRLTDELGRVWSLKPLEPHYLGGMADLQIRGSAPISGKKGEFLGSMFKLLEVGDAYNKTITQRRELLTRAYTYAKKELPKADKAALYKRTEELMTEITQAGEMLRAGDKLPKSWHHYVQDVKDIEQAVLRDTFQLGLEGIAKSGSDLLQRAKILQLFVPFYKTPVNIARETVARTPAGLIKLAWDIGGGKVEGDRAMLEGMAKSVTGTAIMGMIGMAAMAGMITGGGPTDPRRQAVLKQSGWQPYSVKVGDQYIAYNRLEPISSLLGIAADIAEGIQRGDFKKVNTAMERTFSTVAENLTNKTFLAGLEGLFTAWHDPLRYGGRLAKQLQGSLVPNTIGFLPFGSLARALDPVMRETEAFTTSPLQAKIPGASKLLPAQVGPSGEQRERAGSFLERLASPLARSTEKTGPEAEVARELARVNFVPSLPRSVLEVAGRKINLSQQEREHLKRAQLEATRAAARVIKDPTYQRLPDSDQDPRFRPGMKTKHDVLEGIFRRFKREATAMVSKTAYRREGGR